MIFNRPKLLFVDFILYVYSISIFQVYHWGTGSHQMIDKQVSTRHTTLSRHEPFAFHLTSILFSPMNTKTKIHLKRPSLMDGEGVCCESLLTKCLFRFLSL